MKRTTIGSDGKLSSRRTSINSEDMMPEMKMGSKKVGMYEEGGMVQPPKKKGLSGSSTKKKKFLGTGSEKQEIEIERADTNPNSKGELKTLPYIRKKGEPFEKPKTLPNEIGSKTKIVLL